MNALSPRNNPNDNVVNRDHQQVTASSAGLTLRETSLMTDLQHAHRRITVLEHQTRLLQAILAAHNNCHHPPAAQQQQPCLTTTAANLRGLRNSVVSGLRRTISQIRFEGDKREIISREDGISFEMFHAVFADYGTLLQPTPTNKPRSYCFIKTLTTQEAVAVFGCNNNNNKKLEFVGEQWSKKPCKPIAKNETNDHHFQNQPLPTSNQAENQLETVAGALNFFRKKVSVQVVSANVRYSAKTKKLKIRFTVSIKGKDKPPQVCSDE